MSQNKLAAKQLVQFTAHQFKNLAIKYKTKIKISGNPNKMKTKELKK